MAALALLGACGDDPTGTNATVSGSAQFNYIGGGGGSFNANGAVSALASQQTIYSTNWATGWRENSLTSINVAANVPAGASTSNFFGLIIGRQSVGSSNIDVSCTSTNPACTEAFFVIGAAQNGVDFQFYCALESGTVTITAISNDNAQGTFAGSGTCTSGGSSSSQTDFTITGGSFNVPLVVTPPNI